MNILLHFIQKTQLFPGRRGWSTLVLAMLLWGLLSVQPAYAAEINVPCDTAGLYAAIATANGNGAGDTIHLTADCTYTLTGTALEVTNSLTINGNGATIDGNAQSRVLINEGILTVNNLTITGGAALGQPGSGFENGGGIFNSSTIYLYGSTVSGNSATGNGGGIFNRSTVNLYDSTVSGNSAAGDGGGAWNDATLVLHNSIVSGNTAGGDGGGAWNKNQLDLFDSVVRQNTANRGGGFFAASNALAYYSVITNNHAVAEGGGIYNQAGSYLYNTTIAGNTGTLGDGIFNANRASLINTTMVHNGDPATPDLYNPGIVDMKMSIISKCQNLGTVTDNGYNLISENDGCLNAATSFSADPLLEAVQDSNGNLQYYIPQAGSPIINRIPANICGGYDQIRTQRPQGAGCEIGSIEIINAAPDCSAVVATPASLWPPNHKFQPITLSGATDPDGDSLRLTVTGVMQDEPVDASEADARIMGGGVEVRAERNGSGNGRVYHIAFTADDGFGNACSGTVQVGVPHAKNSTAIDDGPLYDSLVAVQSSAVQAQRTEQVFLPLVSR
ncbi:MAG: choice-of-anchor Q domain-containing protein [Caldilineaceae bacterium]